MTINQITQEHITDQTLDGANHLKDGAGNTLGVTAKVWAPNASQVYFNGDFNGLNSFVKDQDKNLLLQKRGEFWTGFLPSGKSADTYQFYVVGDDGGGFKRDLMLEN